MEMKYIKIRLQPSIYVQYQRNQENIIPSNVLPEATDMSIYEKIVGEADSVRLRTFVCLAL